MPDITDRDFRHRVAVGLVGVWFVMGGEEQSHGETPREREHLIGQRGGT
ncbi:hypothetical protein ACWGKK_39050 [Streptomyces chartreusis]